MNENADTYQLHRDRDGDQGLEERDEKLHGTGAQQAACQTPIVDTARGVVSIGAEMDIGTVKARCQRMQERLSTA